MIVAIRRANLGKFLCLFAPFCGCLGTPNDFALNDFASLRLVLRVFADST
jgi:hypothetical protein